MALELDKSYYKNINLWLKVLHRNNKFYINKLKN